MFSHPILPTVDIPFDVIDGFELFPGCLKGGFDFPLGILAELGIALLSRAYSG